MADDRFPIIHRHDDKLYHSALRGRGRSHRDDGPTIERADGTKEWRLNGKLHRDNDLPAVEAADGTKEWWVNGERHRVDGPAIEWASGFNQWYQNGELLLDDVTKLARDEQEANH